ncbi:Chemotaxis response regulator protein-glutamate methylesterase [Anatilimnocola aggregata]|uniref:Protein-glutamate methylesterase/protein-glutamine glutaminase n=1 Tax=Anatilimnocola aggregata TaxID=2528021 RepID=A0A517Y4P5_9BACT|nr:chemotaxis response regulator protein-glutamate methylesterase [Anatilimnocola aggregata]QDU25221.1 Chemotaxis response regulator protein-glutamate methylesterase [Anatilimnocola aggregata]
MKADKITRVLVVDDSPLMRALICDAIATASDMQVVGQAEDGIEALKQFEALQPDVVTLDIQMPRRNGLETLQDLLARRPVPVLMCSSLTTLGAEITLTALEQGALDYVAKPESGRLGNELLRDELLRKIRLLSGADVARILEIRRKRQAQRPARNPATALSSTLSAQKALNDQAGKVIALGISTGGPPALHSLFETFRAPLPPLVIVQHMPQHFTKSLAGRLDRLGPIRCKEAETGDVLQSNHAYLAAGGMHLKLERGPSGVRCVVYNGDLVTGHRPSIDVMMTSAADLFRAKCLGVIMTGMGRDGADGCRAIRKAGGFVLGQDEASSDVYGMNRAAMLEGQVDEQFALEDGALAIMTHALQLGMSVAR